MEKIEMRRVEINLSRELIQMINTAFDEIKENHNKILNVSTMLTFCSQERTIFFVNMKNPWNESAFI